MSRKKPDPLDDVTRPLPHAVGPEKSVLSSILQQPETFLRLALNENIVESDFYVLAHRTLYGFLVKLHTEEQPIEFVSLVQRLLDQGLLERCGGPGTISDIYSYAPSSCHFSTHLQLVKDKALLREVIQRASRQINSAYDSPDEVRELVEQVGNDAADLKTKTENRASDFRRYRTQLVDPESMEDQVVSYLNGDRVLGGDGFFLSPFDLAFRKHEWTVWLGVSSHGKSQAVQNQVAWLASLGRKSIVASLEQPPEITLGQILKAMTAYPDLAKSEDFKPAYAYINKMVRMYKGQRKTSPRHLLETFRQAYLDDGTDTGVVDNLMCLQVDRGDNSALANAIDEMRVFVSDYPFHLHLVVHPRKQGTNEPANKTPSQQDIRGPAEIGDQPNNVVVVYRDLAKSKKLAEMEADDYTLAERLNFWNSTPCGRISVEKQRLTGTMPIKNVWFDQASNQFMGRPGKASPMFSGRPPWEL